MSTITYKLYASVDSAKAVQPVGDLLGEVNAHLAKMGVGAQIGVRSGRFPIGTLETSREMTRREKCKMKALFAEEGAHLGLRLELIRRQPRNQSRCKPL